MPVPPVPSPAVLQAPAHWQAVDLISDLHLQVSDRPTLEAWQAHLAHTRADAVLILGDLFEVWVGDDAIDHDPFWQAAVQTLAHTARHKTVGLLRGNRDFLIGPDFFARTGLMELADPTLLIFAGVRTLLSHGDALCLGDVDYQRFRQLSRTPEWQSQFLGQSLSERLAMAERMRAQSEAHNRGMSAFADADPGLSQDWVRHTGASHLVHGHTHRPADHAHAWGLRQVLTDWDLLAQPPRCGILRLHADGRRERLAPETT